MIVRVLIVCLGTLVIAAACNGGESEDGNDETQQVSGLITNVEARSLLELESLEVTDERGTVWKFQSSRRGLNGGSHDYTPSHLREHMVQGALIVITYIQNEEELTIVNIGE